MATIFRRKNRYQVQVRRKGHPATSKSFVYLSDANRWAKQVEAAQEREDCFPRHDAMPFFELADKFEKIVIAQLKSASKERSRLRLVKRHLGDLSASKVDARCLAHYRDSRVNHVAAQTLKHEVNLIRRVLKFGVQEGYLSLPSGVPIVRLPRLPRGRSTRISPSELQKLIHGCPHDVADVIRLAVETAMRRAEILSLQWDDILPALTHVVLRDTKNGGSRKVPLTPAASDILKARATNTPLFRVKPDYVTKIFKKCARAMGRGDLRFHDLRHEAITRFFERGLSVPEVAAISGHRDYRMLARYTHLNVDLSELSRPEINGNLIE